MYAPFFTIFGFIIKIHETTITNILLSLKTPKITK